MLWMSESLISVGVISHVAKVKPSALSRLLVKIRRSRTGETALMTLLLGSLSGVASYRIVEDHGDAPIKLANEEYKTVIILESPGKGQYAVRGETECLPTS